MTKDIRSRFTFRMPEHLYRLLDERADEIGVSKNALILQILWDYEEKKEGAASHAEPHEPSHGEQGVRKWHK